MRQRGKDGEWLQVSSKADEKRLNRLQEFSKVKMKIIGKVARVV